MGQDMYLNWKEARVILKCYWNFILKFHIEISP